MTDADDYCRAAREAVLRREAAAARRRQGDPWETAFRAQQLEVARLDAEAQRLLEPLADARAAFQKADDNHRRARRALIAKMRDRT